jgi:murein DD-endopeptidase MepM/ murein hydrolase activator NlpD
MKLSYLLQRKEALLSRFRRAYRHSELRKVRQWLKGKSLHWTLYMTAASLFVGGALGLYALVTSYHYVVRVGRQEVGLVRDAKEVNAFVDQLMDQCSALFNMNVFPAQEITLTKELRWGQQADLAQTEGSLRRQIRLVTEAVMVMVNGEPIIPVSTECEIDSVIQRLGLAYVTPCDKVKLLDVELQEEIDGQLYVTPPENVFTAQEVADLLTRPDTVRPQLLASRDLLISRSERSEHELISLLEDPEVAEIPEVNVITVEEAILEHKIPFSTTYVNNSNMLIGQKRVVTPGADGLKEGIYRITRENGEEVDRETLSERVIEEPVAQVVERGTGLRFTWPVAGGGLLTQGFRGRPHMGLDIAAPVGTPILAADSGTVARVGNAWPMGLYIVLHHGEYWTLYLHNSRNLVSVGQRVSRGQTIAHLGSTGRTTGPHLHFEVRRSNGSGHWGHWHAHPAVNPLTYFR